MSCIGHLFDIPKQLKTDIVFDQSVFVKEAIKTVLHEGLIGLVLTSLMILIFLGSMRATVAVLLSIPLSALATFVCLYMYGQHGQHHDSGRPGAGLLARHRQLGDLARKHLPAPGNGILPRGGGEQGGAEVNLAVLAATLVDVVDFFPVTFLYGVSKFLFSALALAFCLSLLASFVVAMTVIPLFCSKFLKGVHHAHSAAGLRGRLGGAGKALVGRPVQRLVQPEVRRLLDFYERWVRRALKRPGPDGDRS